MSNYKALSGLRIKYLSSDPANPIVGEMWYNSSEFKIKCAPLIAAWSSGGNMNTGINYRYAGGTQTAAFGAGGYNPALPHLAVDANTEEYDGSSWTNTNDMGTARYSGCGCGTQTAGLATGGTSSSGNADLNNEEYNGSTWTEAGNISTGHGYGYNCGLQTAALMATGLSDPSPATPTVNAETYDGTSWTEVNNVPATRNNSGASGVLTDGLIFGGANPGVSPAILTNSFSYDGTNWASSPALGTAAVYGNKGESESDTTSAIFFGTGPGGPLVITQEFNKAATVRSVDVS